VVKTFGSLLVEADDEKFLEAKVEPARTLVDLNSINVRELRIEYVRRQQNYDTTPFDPEGRSLRLFPGSVSIWSGMPGAGKTTLLRQLACHLLSKGNGVFVASFEEEPLDVFYHHVRVAAGTHDPTEHQLQWFIDAFSDRFRIWKDDAVLPSYAGLLAAIRVLGRQGVRHAIIDNLMCLDVGAVDWEGQRNFAVQVARTAKLSGVHIHVVAHPKKITQANQEPHVHDVAGSKDLSGVCANVIFVRRDEEANTLGDCPVTTMRIAIRKQRHYTGGQGNMDGWFNRRTLQYMPSQWDTQITQYLPDDAYVGVA
jgi:twinkle protein